MSFRAPVKAETCRSLARLREIIADTTAKVEELEKLSHMM
jgi:hypothetical protein